MSGQDVERLCSWSTRTKQYHVCFLAVEAMRQYGVLADKVCGGVDGCVGGWIRVGGWVDVCVRGCACVYICVCAHTIHPPPRTITHTHQHTLRNASLHYIIVY